MAHRLVVIVLVACAARQRPAPAPLDADSLARAVWRGDPASVHALLARGADPDAEGADGRTPWQWAVTARDRELTELLLARAPRLADRLSTRLALRTAAARDDAWLVDALVTRGVSVDGEIDARPSALFVAAENGASAAIERLLAAGASAVRADSEGDTPIAAAVRAGCHTCVELLRSHGATPASRAPAWDPAPTIAAAIDRAIPLLQRANAKWQGDGECTACHHLPMAIRAIALADKRGVAIDRKLADEAVAAVRGDDAKFEAIARTALETDDGVLRLGMDTGGDPAFANAWFLAAELDAGLPASSAQRTLATLLARMQQPDGRWRSGPLRGVIEWSDLETTALVMRVIAGYGDATARAVLPAAERWLAKAPPASVVDRAFSLWVARDRAREIAALRALQNEDGSWSHTGGAGDAYSTGLVVVALVEAGRVDPSERTIADGVEYLRRTQLADGSWLVPSRAPPLLEMHDHGSPHGRLQFISYAGTAWATMAMIHASSARRSAE